ncbi:hypothetical protein Pelo_3091 [Pelomyxa schiedti]|nr:hypothetical protein Pelo_3091 [Pelomyxa schiedti]
MSATTTRPGKGKGGGDGETPNNEAPNSTTTGREIVEPKKKGTGKAPPRKRAAAPIHRVKPHRAGNKLYKTDSKIHGHKKVAVPEEYSSDEKDDEDEEVATHDDEDDDDDSAEGKEDEEKVTPVQQDNAVTTSSTSSRPDNKAAVYTSIGRIKNMQGQLARLLPRIDREIEDLHKNFRKYVEYH